MNMKNNTGLDKRISLIDMNNVGTDNNVVITRPVYTQHEFDVDYSSTLTKESLQKRLLRKFHNYGHRHCSTTGIARFCLNRFPFISIMGKYKWRDWIAADIIAGLIIGIMHIPQGMAYAMLVGLEPMYGLYVSFFPGLIYFFFGTSRHFSIGTDAIISLLTGKFLENSLERYPLNLSMSVDNGTVVIGEEQMKASRVAGLTLCVGLVQFLMSVFQLGFLARYLSDPLISGFTVGAAIHVFTSQLAACFGIKIFKPHGIFEVPKTLYEIFKNISRTNVPTIIMTLISLALLLFTKEYLNPMVIDKIRVPIPIELVLIICGIISSEYLDLHGKYGVMIVGNITQGLPAPVIPDLMYMSSFVMDIFITTLISFSICIALSNMFTERHGYVIQPNQEYLAFGLMNIFSSFFLCYPSSPSLSRSAVQESIGGKTQITSLVAAVLLLFVLLFIGHFFYALPQCILAAFIVVALKNMFLKLIELKELWIFSFWDFAAWAVTFLTTVFLDIDYGLIIGVTLAILTAMLRTQSPKSHLLGQVAGTDIYKSIESYQACKEIEGIKIFRFEGSLYYASSHHFRNSLFKKIVHDPRKMILKIMKLQQQIHSIEHKLKREKSLNLMESNELSEKKKVLELRLEILRTPSVHHVIIDCSTWGYIDYVGVKTLFQVINEYNKVNVKVFLANPKSDIRKILSRSYNVIDDQIIYVTVHDAVIASLFDQRMETEEQINIRKRLKQQRMVQRWYMSHASQSTPSELDNSIQSLMSPRDSGRPRQRRPRSSASDK